MLLNFCDSRLYPKIICDKVSVDGHEVENLISENFSKRQKGFLGESFIKPPVLVTLSFPCNIEIKRIIINPCVGAQKSSGIEIYSRSNQVRSGPLWRDVSVNPPKEKNDYEFIVSAVFSPIGKVQLSNPGSVCFENQLFQSQTGKELQPVSETSYENCVYLKGRNSRNLNYVSDLNIRIMKTASGRSVAIKSIEVWGQPSRSVPQSVRQKLGQLFTSIPNQVTYVEKFQPQEVEKFQPQEENSPKKSCIPTGSQTVHLENGVEVPDDFIDVVTCEIMTVPMLLPCGKNVDQLTLERHNSVEASWGRIPSDPFTGVPYDDKNKPLPNVPLKVRIDKFVLENSVKLQHIPKTLGSSAGSCSKYERQRKNTSRLIECEKPSENVNNCEQHNESDKTTTTQGRKRRKMFTGFENTTYVRCGEPDGKDSSTRSDVIVSDNSKRADIDPSRSEEKKIKLDFQSSSVKSKTHEEKLKESIDSAFSDILSQLPSFTKSNSNASSSSHVIQTHVKCCSCWEQRESLYRAPCGHLFCRACVLKDSKQGLGVFDKECKKTWKSNQISKVH